MDVKFYVVGGFVRDQILGVRSKDKDFSVEAPSYQAMKDAIINRGGTIFLENPEFFTIRAKIGRETYDYVLCRKEGAYSDGRRPDSVSAGTLYDDLARRDFTMNAIALSEDGEYIDPFNGQQDISYCLISCVGEAEDRFNEDALRMLRAIRFAVTKGFTLTADIQDCLGQQSMVDKLASVSTERIREETLRCFKHNSRMSMYFFQVLFPLVGEYVFTKTGLWLKPTLEQR